MATKKATIKVLSANALKKKYPSAGLASVIAVPAENILRIPTRNIPLNFQLNGGLPYGKILEMFGEESTGKSLLSMDFAYCTQALGGEVIWADAENAFHAGWFEQNGLDLSRIHLLPEENAIEVISDWCRDTIIEVRSRLVKNEPILFVVDSTAALDCLENINTSQLEAKAEMGNRAKAIYKFLRIRNKMFAEYGVGVILINQLRKKVGASKYEDPDTTPGGAASKFYAAQRLGLVRGKQILKKIGGVEKKVGQNVYLKTKKDKTGPPRSTTASQVYFIKTKNNPVGFDKYAGLPEILTQLEIVTRKKGSSRYYFGDKMIAHGEEKFIEVLKENDELRKKLISKAKINTISKTKSQLENITKNLYPVKAGKDDVQEES